MAFTSPLDRALQLCLYNNSSAVADKIAEAEKSGVSSFRRDYQGYQKINRLADEITVSRFEKYSEIQTACYTDANLNNLTICDLVEFTTGSYQGVYNVQGINISDGFFVIGEPFIDESLSSTCSLLQKVDYNEACAWYILASTSLTAQEITQGEVLTNSQTVGQGEVVPSKQNEVMKYQQRCYENAWRIVGKPKPKATVYFG